MIKTILLDVDGVVADFYSAALRAHGADPKKMRPGEWDIPGQLGLTETAFWSKIDNHGFWLTLEGYPGHLEFVRDLHQYADWRSIKLVFCTTPSLNPECCRAKVEWLRTQYRDIFGPALTNYILVGHDKSVLARPDSFLIDDRDKTIEDFKAAGGRALLFPRPWNSRWAEYQRPNTDCYQYVLAATRSLVVRLYGAVCAGPPKRSPDENGPAVTSKPTNPKDIIGSGKLPLELVPDTLEIEACPAFLEGALKYGRFNWRIAGVRASIYYAALKRHQKKWWSGQDRDPGTRVKHLSSALACIGILLDAELCGKLTDDRPPRAPIDRPIDDADELVRHLKERFEKCQPLHYTIKDGQGEP